MLSNTRHRHTRAAAATVEFAISLVLLVMFIFATFEFSRISMLRHSVDIAAYEGARNAIVPGATVADARDAANDLLNRAGIKDGIITVTPNPIKEDSSSVRVHVCVPIAANSWVVPQYFDEATISSEIRLLTERVPLVQARGLPEPPTPPTTP